MRDAVRLALGTLTVLPTRPPAVVDREVAGRAMTLAPLVGAVLAVLSGLLLVLLGWGLPGDPTPLATILGDPGLERRAHPFLAATLVVGLLAVLTRGMHLDGLADTADGFGSGRRAEEALEVMRSGDVGPFGVVTLVLVVLLQVFALGVLVAEGLGLAGLFLALVVSRLVLPLACSRGVPAARADGLGRVVAGAVRPSQLLVAVVLAVVVLVPPALLSPGVHALGVAVVLRTAAVSGVALVVAWLVVRAAVRRLGGVTGDVLGAAVETAFTTVLVVLTLAA